MEWNTLIEQFKQEIGDMSVQSMDKMLKKSNNPLAFLGGDEG
jgi:hypothetical protein